MDRVTRKRLENLALFAEDMHESYRDSALDELRARGDVYKIVAETLRSILDEEVDNAVAQSLSTV